MCCGQKRTQVHRSIQDRRISNRNERTGFQSQFENSHLAYFQYIGQKKLTVLGPKSNKSYRFANPGAVVAVDSRDKRALAGVPMLRLVEK